MYFKILMYKYNNVECFIRLVEMFFIVLINSKSVRRIDYGKNYTRNHEII